MSAFERLYRCCSHRDGICPHVHGSHRCLTLEELALRLIVSLEEKSLELASPIAMGVSKVGENIIILLSLR